MLRIVLRPLQFSERVGAIGHSLVLRFDFGDTLNGYGTVVGGSGMGNMDGEWYGESKAASRVSRPRGCWILGCCLWRTAWPG